LFDDLRTLATPVIYLPLALAACPIYLVCVVAQASDWLSNNRLTNVRNKYRLTGGLLANCVNTNNNNNNNNRKVKLIARLASY